MSLDYRMLGPVEVLVDGRPVRLRGPKQRTLLAALVVNRGRVVGVDTLVDALWDGDPPATATAQLHSHVSMLRKIVGADTVAREQAGYRLTQGKSDIDTFDCLVAGEGNSVERITEAIALWRGPALTGTEPHFRLRHAPALEERLIAAHEMRVDAQLARGQDADLVPGLRALIAEHPVRDRLREQLMLALHRAGRTTEALAAYREYRDLLVDEHGIDPGQSVSDLHTRILRGDPALCSPRPVKPLPVNRRTFVARAAGLAAVALMATVVADNVLPIPPRSFPYFEVSLYDQGVMFWTDVDHCASGDQYRLVYDLPMAARGRATGYRVVHADCTLKLFDGPGGEGRGDALDADGVSHPVDPETSRTGSAIVAYSCCRGTVNPADAR